MDFLADGLLLGVHWWMHPEDVYNRAASRRRVQMVFSMLYKMAVRRVLLKSIIISMRVLCVTSLVYVIDDSFNEAFVC